MAIMKKFVKKQKFTAIVKFKEIGTYDAMMKGVPTLMVAINTDQGSFSNFESVWRAQNIDEERLNEGDTLKITFTKNFYQKTGKFYNNFQRVEVLMNEKLKSEGVAGINESSPLINQSIPNETSNPDVEKLLEGIEV